MAADVVVDQPTFAAAAAAAAVDVVVVVVVLVLVVAESNTADAAVAASDAADDAHTCPQSYRPVELERTDDCSDQDFSRDRMACLLRPTRW